MFSASLSHKLLISRAPKSRCAGSETEDWRSGENGKKMSCNTMSVEAGWLVVGEERRSFLPREASACLYASSWSLIFVQQQRGDEVLKIVFHPTKQTPQGIDKPTHFIV